MDFSVKVNLKIMSARKKSEKRREPHKDTLPSFIIIWHLAEMKSLICIHLSADIGELMGINYSICVHKYPGTWKHTCSTQMGVGKKAERTLSSTGSRETGYL